MKIYINIQPGGIGGPSVFVKNFVRECQARGHKITHKLEPDCNVALNLVTASDGFFNFCKKHGIKTVGRLDGFYIPEYWNNQDKKHLMTMDKIQTNNRMREDLKLYDAVIFQSNWSKAMFDKWIMKRDDARVIYNGVDSKMFRPTTGRKNAVLMLGALRHDYMMNSFFGAYDILAKQKDKFKWLIAGTIDEECKRIFANHSKKPNVVYLGSFNNDNIAKIYNKADVFFHPRAGDSCPNVVIEAMSCGLGIVCPSWGGSAELIGRGGIVVQTNKWSYGNKYQGDCAKAIQEAFKNLELHTFKSRRMVEKFYTIQKMTDQYLEAFK